MGITVTYDNQVKEGIKGLFRNVTLFALNDKGKEYYSFIYEAVVYVDSSLGIKPHKLEFYDIERLLKDIKDILLHESELNKETIISFSVDFCKVNFTVKVNPDNDFEYIDEYILFELLKQVFHLSNLEFNYNIKENQYPGFYNINLHISNSLLTNNIIYEVQDFIIKSNFIPSDSWNVYNSLITVDSLISIINRARGFNYKTLINYCGNGISLIITEDIFAMNEIELNGFLDSIYFELIQEMYRLSDLEVKLFKCVIQNENIFAVDELEYLYSNKCIYSFYKGAWMFSSHVDDKGSELDKYELIEEDNYTHKEPLFVKEYKSYYSVVIANSNKSYTILKSKISV